MKWRGRRGSRNIQDRRGQRTRGRSSINIGGGRGRVGRAGAGGGLGLLAVVVIGLFLGVDLSSLMGQSGGAPLSSSEPREMTAQDREMGEFVSVVLADTEDVWADILPQQAGQNYRAAMLVLFSGATQSQCGGADAATGPFYCPPENSIFLDTDFFITLEQRLGAGGDFAAAYVIAHEVAHHVQNELGILSQANRARSQSSQVRSNEISVMIELQADCFAGVWAREADRRWNILERGDIAEALNAARQIGDDTLQRNSGRLVQPHTFTHGTSEQRQRWFARGFESGQMAQCNTFEARSL